MAQRIAREFENRKNLRREVAHIRGARPQLLPVEIFNRQELHKGEQTKEHKGKTKIGEPVEKDFIKSVSRCNKQSRGG